LTNLEKNELQSVFVVLVTEQAKLALIICYAGCHTLPFHAGE